MTFLQCIIITLCYISEASEREKKRFVDS